MNTEEQVNEWLEISQEDLEVAQLCYSARKFLHCAYMCQQAVEKALKGLIAAQGEIPLPIHNLGNGSRCLGVPEHGTTDFSARIDDLCH